MDTTEVADAEPDADALDTTLVPEDVTESDEESWAWTESAMARRVLKAARRALRRTAMAATRLCGEGELQRWVGETSGAASWPLYTRLGSTRSRGGWAGRRRGG